MTQEINVLVRADDGRRICGLGAVTSPVVTAGVASNMANVIILRDARIEDLLGGSGQRAIMPGVNERQRLTVTNSPGSGTFTLAFKGVWADSPIGRHPAAGDLRAYLESISTIGAGNVFVSKESNWVYLIDFQADLAQQDLPELVADYSNLPAGCTVEISTLIDGAAPPGGTATAVSRLSPDGQLLLDVTDATGQQWTYKVVPAINLGSTYFTFLGQLVEGDPDV